MMKICTIDQPTGYINYKFHNHMNKIMIKQLYKNNYRIKLGTYLYDSDQ